MGLSHSPKIATGGLIGCWDARSVRSYPGSGTTWFDLSGNNNHGSMSSVSYSSDGSMDYSASTNAIVTVPAVGLRPTSGITMEAWFNITNNTVQVFIGMQYGSSSDNSYAIWINATNTLAAGVNTTTTLNFRTLSYTLSTNIWYHYAHTYDGTNQIMYLNGRAINSWGTTGSITYDVNNTNLALGNDYNGAGYNTNSAIAVRGKMAIARIYNRGLSAQEIWQNFNTHRGRFGL